MELWVVIGKEEIEGSRAYVFLDVVQATIIGDESGDLLAVLDELNSDTLANSRVRLLGLNSTIQLFSNPYPINYLNILFWLYLFIHFLKK